MRWSFEDTNEDGFPSANFECCPYFSPTCLSPCFREFNNIEGERKMNEYRKPFSSPFNSFIAKQVKLFFFFSIFYQKVAFPKLSHRFIHSFWFRFCDVSFDCCLNQKKICIGILAGVWNNFEQILHNVGEHSITRRVSLNGGGRFSSWFLTKKKETVEKQKSYSKNWNCKINYIQQ